MDLQTSVLKTSYPNLEKIALGLTATVFLVSLLSQTVGWDWLFDTAYLLAGAYLVLAGPRSAPPLAGPATNAGPGHGLPPPKPISPQPGSAALYVSLYLFADSVLQTFVAMCFPGPMILVYMALTALYGVALASRLRERGIAVDRFHWGRMLEPPALFATIAVLLSLACMYMPMLRLYHPWKVWSGPMVMYLPGTVHMDAGRTLDLGYKVVLRGIQVTLGRAVCLLLAAIAAAHLLRLQDVIPAVGSLRLMRISAIPVGFWWVLFGKGYQSLDNIFNLLFIAAYGLLLVLLFTPSKLPMPASQTKGSKAA